MSASDALAAIQTIHSVVSKVKDNQDELRSLSNRLQFVVESVEESRRRDVIRDTEYNDSLTTVSELVARTQRLARRMLKRSLGDRTWNAGEIASELRRLNEDVQTFITVHTIKTLDLVQTAQSQQQQYLITTIEEIIAKITELDLKLIPLPSPNRVTRRAVRSTRGARSTELQRSSAPHSRTAATPQVLTNTLGEIPIARDDDQGIVLDRLTNPHSLQVTISGLLKTSGNGDLHNPIPPTQFAFGENANADQMMQAIEAAGYMRPNALFEDKHLIIQVTEDESVYDARVPGGLQINVHEPLLWWKDKYDEYHGLSTPTIPMKTDVFWTKDSLRVDELVVQCHRTLRVPDQGIMTAQPPSLGTFPIFHISHFGQRVPEDMKCRGGFVIPMFRREALMIRFLSSLHRPAVKVSVGGINAISGAPTHYPSPLRSTVQQAYIVAGKQRWLDGIVVGTDTVRQFVVEELHKGYTVEEQVTGQAKIGGLQFDIYPRRQNPGGSFFAVEDYMRYEPGWKTVTSKSAPLSMTATPAELNLQGRKIVFAPMAAPSQTKFPSSAPWTLSGYSRRVSIAPNLLAKYMGLATRPFDGTMDDESYTRRHIAAGGKIEQRIYRDPDSIRVYNEDLGRRVHIHIVTPEVWEDLTNVVPPVTPVDRGLYLRQGIPWFKLYDDYTEGIAETSEALANVVSIRELDRLNTKVEPIHDAVLDPSAPPPCLHHHQSTSTCVFRPCGHAVCFDCVGSALLKGSRCTCGSDISKFIDIKLPFSELEQSHGSDGVDDKWNDWIDDDDDGEDEIENVARDAVRLGQVTIIHLKEDNVAPLHQLRIGDTTQARNERAWNSS